MSEKKIVVPEGMLKAAHNFLWKKWGYESTLGPVSVNDANWDNTDSAIEAALQWLSDNPIVPRRDQYLPSLSYVNSSSNWPKGSEEIYARQSYREGICRCLAEWEGRMFLASETEVPEAIKDLQWSEPFYRGDQGFAEAIPKINESIVEAYRRGKESK